MLTNPVKARQKRTELQEFYWGRAMDAVIARHEGWQNIKGDDWLTPDGDVVDRRFVPSYHSNLALISAVADAHDVFVTKVRGTGFFGRATYRAFQLVEDDVPGDPEADWLLHAQSSFESYSRPLALTLAVIYQITGEDPETWDEMPSWRMEGYRT